MADTYQKIKITGDDFNRLKNDIHQLEEEYFDASYNSRKPNAKIDYRETIRLISVARDLQKLNIKLNRLYRDFKRFVGYDDADKSTSGKNTVGGLTRSRYAGDADDYTQGAYSTGEIIHKTYSADDAVQDLINTDYTTQNMFNINSSNSGDFYNDFIFGLRREIPPSISQQLDFHAKDANVIINRDVFKKIVAEILDYEKNYNNKIFTHGGLFNVLKSDILKNGREVLLPYVISNVLTYLQDSNFIGNYSKKMQNTYTILDRDGLKLWANSIL